MNQQKQCMRKLFIEKRSKLTIDEIKDKSRTIITGLKRLEQFKNSKMIFTYIEANNEVITQDFINYCIDSGKTVCLPFTLKKQLSVEAYRIYNIPTDVKKGSYGIYEPIPWEERKISPIDIDFAVVPGVGFDVRKNRIGYGKGYYDRFLAKLSPTAVKVGLAFDFQVADELPVEKLDIKMDIIITETRVII